MSARPSDPRLGSVLDRVDRTLFIASPDLRQVISGRSIPSRSAARQLLALIGTVPASARVLVVGGGSGYIPALLAGMAGRVDVLEKEPAIAGIARTNLARAGLDGVDVRVGIGEDGWPEKDARFDRIIAICSLKKVSVLLEQLDTEGLLFTLEGPEREQPLLVQRSSGSDGPIRQALGSVLFSRPTSQVLIDLGFVDEAMLEKAREEARRRHEPVLTVIRNRLGVNDVDFYRTLARQRDIEFIGADKVLERLDTSLFHHYSHTFLDNRRLLPVWKHADALVVVTDNPDLSAEDLMGMENAGRIKRMLVTPTDFRRIWSALELTDRRRADAELVGGARRSGGQ